MSVLCVLSIRCTECTLIFWLMNSWERNARKLEAKTAELVAVAQSLELSFNIAKTELMHWRKRKDKDLRPPYSVMIQAHVVKPAGQVIRWLGYWLTYNGETSTHFTKRLTLAQGAFWRFQRLSLPGKGLSPYGARRLAKGILLPTLLYRVEFMEPSKGMLGKMQVFWNWVLRWITSGFYSTNLSVLSAEVCLAPIVIYAEQARLMSAVRITSAIPENNIATAMMSMSFPIRMSRSSRSWLYFLCYLGMLLFVLCFEILSVCTLRKDGVL